MSVIPPSFPHSEFIQQSVLSFRDENQWAGMMGWCRTDVNESGMSSFHSHAIIPMSSHHSGGIPPFKTFKTRGSDASELAFSKSQSTHHPLQRMMGGLTCPFEWYWMIRMILKWWTEGGMMSTVIPRSSVKSVHPSSSAEDDGWTDLSLWMILND